MSSIVVYSSSSDSSSSSLSENDDNENETNVKKFKSQSRLPAAKLLLGTSKRQEEEENEEISLNDTNLHDGRKRRFPHVRGNWPTFVYIPVCSDFLEKLRSQYCNELQGSVNLRPTDHLHISLSRTVVLRHHQIDGFVESLARQLKGCDRFSVSFRGLKAYTNDDKTRTFIACQVDELFADPLNALIHKVDSLMDEFKMPVFYEEASFHVSILWCLGNHLDVLRNHLNKTSAAAIESNITHTFSTCVEQILCAIGNRKFTFQLKK